MTSPLTRELARHGLHLFVMYLDSGLTKLTPQFFARCRAQSSQRRLFIILRPLSVLRKASQKEDTFRGQCSGRRNPITGLQGGTADRKS